MAVTVWWYTLVSTLIISLLALAGVLTLYVSGERLHEFLMPMVGFAAGSLLGNVFLELLPDLVERKGAMDATSSFLLLAGILSFFLMEQRIRRWQAAHVLRENHPARLSHVSPRPEGTEDTAALLEARPFAVVNLGGDLLHNFIDGLAVGGAFLFDIQLGIATAVAVALHEIPQELGDFAVLVHAGLGRRRALIYNFVTALSAVIGGITALVIGTASAAFPLYLIPFTAGGFVYLALGDLIPELHAHGRPGHTTWGVVGLIAGISLMGAIRLVGG